MLRTILLLTLCSAFLTGCRPRVETDSRGDTSRAEAGTPRPSAHDSIPPDTPLPAPSAHDSATADSEGNIRVETPRPNQKIGTEGIELSGTARTFENGLTYRLLGADGATLAEGHLTSKGEMGHFNPYRTSITLPDGGAGEMRLEVFQFSAKDGSEIDKVVVPLRASGRATGGMTQLQIFWTSPRMGSSVDCQKVFPVIRSVPHTTEVAAAALDQLLRGPSGADADGGYRSEIPSGTTLKGVTIENGTAHADFSSELRHVAGSCRVVAIRAQIERTLRQFPSVKSVVISIDGSSVGVLQP
ncbi:MAG: hypothetical protein JWQ98_1567 [Chlorobi bacterium]|nr:hypothetical protein [Chlorobiota bacterium]